MVEKIQNVFHDVVISQAFLSIKIMFGTNESMQQVITMTEIRFLYGQQLND